MAANVNVTSTGQRHLVADLQHFHLQIQLESNYHHHPPTPHCLMLSREGFFSPSTHPKCSCTVFDDWIVFFLPADQQLVLVNDMSHYGIAL